jgi:hypothetical protein
MGDQARWISVGELAAAFGPDTYTPRPTSDLAGSAQTLYFDDNRVVEHRFLSDSRLAWTVDGGVADGTGGEAGYSALKVRDGIYFVDFVAHQTPPTAISLVLDLGQRIATALVARLPDSPDVGCSLASRIAAGEELTAVSVDFSSAAIGTPFTAATARHEPTCDLIGRRVEYTYSPTERYEHIYLNEDFYTWHCLLGSEKGLADTDRCHYFRLADQLYLFVWREKIVPTLGAVVADFVAMRTMGKIFGHAQVRDADGGHAQPGHAPSGSAQPRGVGGGHDGPAPPGLVNFLVGARARLLNVTGHDAGSES